MSDDRDTQVSKKVTKDNQVRHQSPRSGNKKIKREGRTHTKCPHIRQNMLRDTSSLPPKQMHHRRSQVKARTPRVDMGKARIVKSTSNVSKRVEG